MIATLTARHAIARMNRVAAEADTVFVALHRANDAPDARMRLTR
ncbi:hypothetical protein [Burkholderia sp. BCC0405]|nr:hypothetical protein [Burkholderia sp. BCC0405]